MELIDVPTAEVLDRYGFDSTFRFYSGGGMLAKTHFGVFPRLNVGFSLDADGFVGEPIGGSAQAHAERAISIF
jgi:hypothetical protein